MVKSDSRGRRPIALITGATGAIGEAIAMELAGQGYDLALLGRDKARLDEVQKAAEAAGATAIAVSCDVKNANEARDAVNLVLDRFTWIDALILSAGTCKYGRFLDLDEDDWVDMLSVNVLGVVHTIRPALPQMIAGGRGGHILLIGSRRGLEPSFETSAYSASKAALHGLAKSLSAEISTHGIHVSLLVPGGVKSSLRGASTAEMESWLEPADVAGAVRFMLSNDARAFVRNLEIVPLGRG